MFTKNLTINLSRQKNEVHAQFHETVVMLIENVTPSALGIEALYQFYRPAFNNELDALDIITKSEFTEQISEQDRVRDSIFRGFSDAVKSYRNHFDATYRVAANKLWNVFLHYGNIAGKTLDAQTATVNDILREFQKPELVDALNILQLNEWKDKMDEENQKFQQLMMDRYNEAVGKTTFRMQTARVETDKYYRAILADLNNKLLIGNNDQVFNDFIIELNAIIKRYKDILAQEFGRKNKIETTEQAPNEQNHQHQPHWTPVPPRDNDKPFEK